MVQSVYRDGGTFDQRYEAIGQWRTYSIAQLLPYEQISFDYGVYVVTLDNGARSHSARAALRVPSTDQRGIVYIGGSRSLRKRMQYLAASVRPETDGLRHPVGWCLKHGLEIPSPELWRYLLVHVHPTHDPRKLEVELLKAYEAQYGARPVFNVNI